MSCDLSHLVPFQKSRDNRITTIQNVSALLSATQSLSISHQKTCTTILPSLRESKATLRTLSLQDIEILEINGCSCDDWSIVYLLHHCCEGESDSSMSEASIGKAIKDQLKHCTFSGRIILGLDVRKSTRGKESNPKSLLKPGIHSNTVISNSIIEPGAKVFNNTIISDTFIGANATVLNCGSITYETSSKDTFYDTMTIGVGPEAGGGRPVQVNPESTLVDVCASLSMSCSAASNINTPSPMPMRTINGINVNVICGNILHTSCANNIYLSLNATIQSSSSVQNAILLPQSSIQNSIVDSVFLQWKSAIVNNSNVSSTLLMECAEIGPNSVVASTILGPDSHVSCGEVHCSVIGPNTNAHHQSLLISALWPTGRGNVGYGSNIGSNHTGRIPDQ